MWWQYAVVFLAAFIFDVVPLPLPPAFTAMVFFQIKYDLNIWVVIVIGVIGSILGRYLLTLYIPYVSKTLFKPSKNEDVQYLGSRMKEKGWKSQVSIIVYSLMPLPTTPLFIAAGMAKLKPIYIIPAFFVGKFTSDTIAVLMGEYAARNAPDILSGSFGWKSVTGLIVGFLLLSGLLFIDWRTLLQKNKLTLKLKIWK